MITNEEFSRYIAELAQKAMLYEVSTTPKPGLVDRNNSGAHRDMDFFTFLSSTSALADTFYMCALIGTEFNEGDYRDLLDQIRPIGILGEERMFAATKGVNTHKGLIFSLGIISAAAGSIYREYDIKIIDHSILCQRVKEMTQGITKEFEGLEVREDLTYGERLFKEYGIKGIRGEVEEGFETVRRKGLPVLEELMEGKKLHINDILVQVLLHLMTETEDSNILGRHDYGTLKYVMEGAKKAILLGGIFTPDGREYIADMDRDFISKNISPGGSADLLAVTLMLYFLQKT